MYRTHKNRKWMESAKIWAGIRKLILSNNTEVELIIFDKNTRVLLSHKVIKGIKNKTVIT